MVLRIAVPAALIVGLLGSLKVDNSGAGLGEEAAGEGAGYVGAAVEDLKSGKSAELGENLSILPFEICPFEKNGSTVQCSGTKLGLYPPSTFRVAPVI